MSGLDDKISISGRMIGEKNQCVAERKRRLENGAPRDRKTEKVNYVSVFIKICN